MQLTPLFKKTSQLSTKVVFSRITQAWRLWPETTTTNPFLVAVLALEKTDEQLKAGINAFTRVAGLLLSLIVRTLAFAIFCIGLNLDGTLCLFKHHSERKHDDKGRQPCGVLAATSVESSLLPFEYVFVYLVPENVEEEFQLTVGKPWGSVWYKVGRLVRAAKMGVDHRKCLLCDRENVAHNVCDDKHADDSAQKLLKLE